MAEEKTSFISHLEELRKRIIICLVAIGAGFGICCFFDKKIVDIIMKPLINAMPLGTDRSIQFQGAEAFFANLKVSFFAGISLAAPVILYEIWCFISPGLYNKEKKYVFPFVLFSTLLFLSGVLFCYFLALPVAFQFFMSYTSETMKPLNYLGQNLSLILKMLLAFGILFQLPIFMFFLSKIGIVNVRMLSRNRKYAILVIFIIAAVITPTGDAVTQTITALPLYILYELSIVLIWAFNRKKESLQDAS
jgi:sec-independent protein translocase protein TatC